MTVMSGAAISPVLAELHDAMGVSSSEGLVRLVLILPAIVVLFFGPYVGQLSARYSPRLVLCSGLALLALAGALGGAAASYGWLLATRSVLGLATAAVLCASTTAIVCFFEGKARSRMMSAQTACNTLSGVVFISFGGLLATADWRLAFAIYLLAAPVALLAWRLDWGPVPAPPAKRRRIGIRPDLPTLGMICVAMGCFYLLPSQVPFLQDRINGPAQAALVIAAGTLASAVLAMAAPRFSHIFGRNGAITLAVAGMALGNLLMTLASGPSLATLAALLIGGGFGLILPLAISTLMERADPADRNAKSGWIASAIYSGQVLAVIIATATAQWGAAVPFGLIAVLLFLGFLATQAHRAASVLVARAVSLAGRGSIRDEDSP